MERKLSGAGQSPPKIPAYLPIWHRVLGRILLLFPGLLEVAFGIGLLAEINDPTDVSQWLTANGVSIELIAWLNILGGVLFVVYNLWLRSGGLLDIAASGLLNSPLPGRVLMANLYSIQAGTFTIYGAIVTWGLYLLLLGVYVYVWATEAALPGADDA